MGRRPSKKPGGDRMSTFRAATDAAMAKFDESFAEVKAREEAALAALDPEDHQARAQVILDSLAEVRDLKQEARTAAQALPKVDLL